MEALFLGDLAVGSERLKLNFANLPFAEKRVINFEGPLFNKDEINKPLKRAFYNSRASLYALESLGISHINVLNNHSLDLGKDVLKNSVKKLQDIGYNIINYQNLNITPLSSDLGIVSVGSRLIGTPREWPFLEDNAIVEKLSNSIKISGLNRIVLFVHAGFEFEKHPEPWLREKLKSIAEIPEVCLVLCMHSHVVKGFDRVKGTYIFYGLGNFFIENYHYFQKKLVYDELCNIGLAVGISEANIIVYETIKSDNSVRFKAVDFENTLENYGLISDYGSYYDLNRRSYRLMIMPPKNLRGFYGNFYVRLIEIRAALIKALIPIKDKLNWSSKLKTNFKFLLNN